MVYITDPLASIARGSGTFSNVTPFTYRDGMTFLQKLELIARKLGQIIDWADNVEISIGQLTALINTEIARVEREHDKDIADVKAALDALRVELFAAIGEAYAGGVAFDPTTGTNHLTVSQVISNVYDNVRVYAYFASQFDELELTAAEFDALDMSARKFDLAALDTINATND